MDQLLLSQHTEVEEWINTSSEGSAYLLIEGSVEKPSSGTMGLQAGAYIYRKCSSITKPQILNWLGLMVNVKISFTL